MPLSGAPVRVFLSYAWEDDTYRELVKSLAVRLREDGIEARLDAWHLDGLTVPEFMSREVRHAVYTLVLCSPAYQRKVHAMEDGEKIAGSGWEHMLLTSAIWTGTIDRSKVVPILFKGDWREAAPLFLAGLPYKRLNDEDTFEAEYRALLQLLTGNIAKAPKLGEVPGGLGDAPVKAMRGRSQIRTFTNKLPTVDPLLIGREKELAFLDEAWANPNTNVVQIIASGGTGKTALIVKWFLRHSNEATIFGWSFYSQGTNEKSRTSSDSFFAHALKWFGVNVEVTASPWEKASALAERLCQERVLLLLDGVEPLQDASGEMKDQALKALLKDLDTHNAGLVLCTTRIPINDIPPDDDRALSWDLDNLSPEASVAYLRKIGVKGEDEELQAAAREYDNHALALTLLGHYLVDFCDADVRREVEIPKLMVDEVKQGGHARRVMAAYEKAFAGKPELDILKGLGYFNRPVEPEALQLVLPKTTPLRYKVALKRLRELRLLLDQDDSKMLDSHPLIREYFSQFAIPEWHARLYRYYEKQAQYRPNTLEEMTPLFHAVHHGCQAGMHNEVLESVYRDRIRRGDEGYLWRSLGAFGLNLSLLAGFFQTLWTQPISSLPVGTRYWLMNSAAVALRGIGRLDETITSMQSTANAAMESGDWKNAAALHSNLSEIQLTLGNIESSITAGRLSVLCADKSADVFQQMVKRPTLAEALHQSGDFVASQGLFLECERLQKQLEPLRPTLYSFRGFQYCDLLLSLGHLDEVLQRATQAYAISQLGSRLLDVALDRVSLARVGLSVHLDQAVTDLRNYGSIQHLPLGLLARGTQHDLDEVYKIATRSGMRLHLTDYHLKQATLDLANGNQAKAREHTQKAADLIQATGYHRRDPDLARLRQQLDPPPTDPPSAPQPRTQ